MISILGKNKNEKKIYSFAPPPPPKLSSGMISH